MASEREIISKIRRLAENRANDGLVFGIGDDCAVIRPDDRMVQLLTTDALVEKVHFDLAWHSPFLLGRKAASVNISDIAAMGGVPRYALLSIAIPDSFRNSGLTEFLAGFAEVLQEYNVSLIGGDTVRCSATAVFNVTIVGVADRKKVLYRSGARDGDLIWVSGPLGEAAAGLELCRRGGIAGDSQFQSLIKAHLDPAPQVRLGQVLADSGQVHAMLDLSDGLATDLAHLCAESGKGAEIYMDKLPGSGLLAAAAQQLQMPVLDWQIRGGEDYHLLFTSGSDSAEDLQNLTYGRLGRRIHCVGRIVAGNDVVLCRPGEAGEKKKISIAYQGYDHFS